MFKQWILKQVMKRQVKDLPPDQKNMILALVEKHPEVFEKMASEIKAAKKRGVPESTASMQVMLKYRQELQRLAQNLQ